MRKTIWVWQLLSSAALGVGFAIWHVGALLGAAVVLAFMSIDNGLRNRVLYPLFIVISVGVILAGWGAYVDHVRNASQIQPVPVSGGTPFLSGYLDTIRGVRSPDTACAPPKDLHDLLLPCDK